MDCCSSCLLFTFETRNEIPILQFQQELYTEEAACDLLDEMSLGNFSKIIILNFDESEQDAYDAIRSKVKVDEQFGRKLSLMKIG